LIYRAAFHTFVKISKDFTFMQAAEYYLRELLFAYDCVTIPGLGGFIMQSQPARIDREKNRIYPPSRYPSFNSLLNHDDGLLVSAIARAEQVSYHDSGIFVHDFVSNCKIRLSLGERILLEGIGEFSANPEGGIMFRHLNQTNFFPGVFGMEPLNIYPVTRQKQQVRIMRKPADRKSLRTNTKQPASVRWTILLSVPVVLFLLYGIIFPTSMQQLYTNYSGMALDFGNSGRGGQTVAARTDKPDHEVLNITAAPDAPVLESPEPAPVEQTTVFAEKVVPASPRYYIIGGCFISEENADKFLQELISRGFEAEKAGSNNRGQTRISYKSFQEKSSAISYLQTIRNEENPSAWLLKY
jgi:hypothetical protein